MTCPDLSCCQTLIKSAFLLMFDTPHPLLKVRPIKDKLQNVLSCVCTARAGHLPENQNSTIKDIQATERRADVNFKILGQTTMYGDYRMGSSTLLSIAASPSAGSFRFSGGAD